VARLIPESAFSKRRHKTLSLTLTEGIKMLTQEYLKECLDYNPETGVFIWRDRPLSHYKCEFDKKCNDGRFFNKEAGTNMANGYLGIKIKGKTYYAHRLAILYVFGKLPEYDTDHINGNKLDNRIANLRIATRSENNQNKKKNQPSNKTTGILGVYFDKNKCKYQAQIKINGNHINLGRFNTAELAHEAYLKKKREIHPFNEL